MTRAEAEASVARGAALLDKKMPGWAAQIDSGRLDMNEPCLCILGQLYGNYYDCVTYVCRDDDAGEFGFGLPQKRAYPFTYGQEEGLAIFSMLQDAWIVAIAARISAPQQSEHEKEQTA